MRQRCIQREKEGDQGGGEGQEGRCQNAQMDGRGCHAIICPN